jgi:TatA/E family protein of Tat protein translocase
MGFIGTTELVLILALAVLLFGPKRIPELARAIRKSFKK